jgi:hypothetical protein
MHDTNPEALTRQILAALATASPPAWLLEMIEHYRQTGSYRPRDLRRLLGDPRESVKVGPNQTVEAALLAAVRCQ